MIMINTDIAHEMMIVGGMIHCPEKCVDYAIAHLGFESFKDPDIAALFKLIKQRYRNKQSIRPDSLLVDLRTEIGGHAAGFLGEITERSMGFDTWNFPYYVSRVQNDDQLRQFKVLRESLDNELEGCERDYTRSPSEIIETMGRGLARISERRNMDVVSVYDSGLEFMDENDSRDDSESGVEFGIPKIDIKLSGLQPGELVTVAGRPGGGKSVASLQACRNVCEAGGAALIVSLEMTRKEICNRIIAGLSTIDVGAIRQRKMGSEDAKLYAQALSKMESWDLFISDRPGQTLEEIKLAAKSQKAKGRLDLLVVDYIRLVKPTNKRLEKRDQIAEVTQGLKELAKELSVPVISVCQMNREADKLAAPKLSNLADSSAVEQDSDIVIFLHRQDPNSVETDFIIAKHRHGMLATEKVELNTVTMMFEQPTDWSA